MTTIRQLIQTSPVRANELFAKLVDTSETAVKTREKLFAELKEELELLAGLEEQHLFPVLRKHKDLKELVRDALNDNKATRKLLTELDHTPKDNEEFASRVEELRRGFQQHVRDEKKELLPAVLKALSDEEAEAVVDRIEAGKAEIEESKRAEAEERRAAAKREREQAVAETNADLARGLQDASGECFEMIQERVQTNLDGVNALVRCRTLPELLQAQGSLFRSNLELTLTNSRRVAEISTRFVENATRTISAQAERSTSRAA